MAEIEYVLNFKGCGMQHSKGVIRLGTQPNLNFTKVLKDNEIDTYLSDTITHEFLHELFEVEFNITTSELLETIQEHFREDIHILKNFIRIQGVALGMKQKE